jgi:propane monooxygenase reductase subunit
MPQPVRFPALVAEVVRHNSDVATYRLHSERRLPAFQPGQFVHLAIDAYDPASHWPDSRVFSVANAVADRQTLELTISRQGAYTTRILDGLKPGDRVWAKGPYGEFTIGAARGVDRAVLIAGGTGITPYCAFMETALVQGSLPLDEVVLHYGARRTDLLIYRDLVERCVATLPGFRAQMHVEHATGEDPTLRLGRLDPRVIVTDLGEFARTAFYISGPKPMIDAFMRGLGEQGVPGEKLNIDAWE